MFYYCTSTGPLGIGSKGPGWREEMNRRAGILCLYLVLPILLLAGCDNEPNPSDAQLGLNPTQIAGRRVFNKYCANCHTAYSSSKRNGPTLQGLFKKPYMPSGTPANDDRVRDVVVLGKSKMPGFGRVLDQEQTDALLAYLHTL